MTKTTKIVAAIVALALLGGWYAGLWRPATRQLAAANTRLTSAQSDQTTAALEDDTVRGKVRRLPQEEAKAAALQAAVPSTAQLDVLIDQVGAIAAEAGVGWQSQSSTSAAAGTTSGSLETMTLSLEVSGSPTQVLRFVTLLQAEPRVVQVGGLQLGGSGPPLAGPPLPGESTSATPTASQTTSMSATLFVDPTPLPSAPKATTPAS